MNRRQAPTNVDSLTRRIENIARERGVPVRRIQRAVANAVVGQMLPPGVVKGGTAMTLRLGEAGSRFTPDLDVSRDLSLGLDVYVELMRDGLGGGWGGFSGIVRELPAPQPADVPGEYVMQPLEVRLAYRGRHWLTVPVELGRDEAGSTVVAEPRVAVDLVELFAALGLDEPAPVPLMAVEHQVVQKLHACTWVNPATGRNGRAHDLVDLQLLVDERFAAADAREIAIRLFASRRAQSWPSVVVAYPGWEGIYAEAADGLAVLADVGAAVAWANELIARIDSSR